MNIRSLKQTSYAKLCKDRPQVLTKDRGYGIVSIIINDLIYAIPLRSNMNHNNGFKTIPIRKNGNIFWNGLDYSKALVVKEEDIEATAFRLKDRAEFNKIQSNKDKIQSEFEKYVSDYILCFKQGKSNTDNRFKFTTLQYFHNELSI
jgi:protein AbiQ